MITRDEARRLKEELLTLLMEDVHNAQRLTSRLDTLSKESGVGAHAALILILTHLAFEEHEARSHWKAVLSHREAMSKAVRRDVGVRVALLDYFMNVNRHLTQPAIIDLEMFDSTDQSSNTDPLTGLTNERAFRTAVQTELRRARRYGQKVSLVLFDLDSFASVGEAHGSIVADRLIREAAILLKNKIRDIDLAARPGEDEFALVLPETDRNGALLVAERYRREIETYFGRREVSGPALETTISGGVAAYPEDASTPEELLERAAQALYRAKAMGKNVVHVFYPERRRYLRFDLEPGRFEVEVLAPRKLPPGAVSNLSRNGIVFSSPERLEVGEEIEIRLRDHERERAVRPVRVRGRVVRLEELPREAGEEALPDGTDGIDLYEVGVALTVDAEEQGEGLVQFLDLAQRQPST